ncbi:uncharacterized protein [Apostichopus japonicus]|uniref:uncharacterized protein isoform X4 n=1 Tax=Stichopus japonicus TaxID=307972 RepID=UPI003AB754B4
MHGDLVTQKMPAASSKPTSQSLEPEVQDPVKLLIGALEKKTRNLEKRKTKLEGYKEMVEGGKALNKDQQEAVSHYQEVQGHLSFAKEFLGTIQTVVSETSKSKKKLEKKENIHRQEQDLKRIQTILLLQNVLNQMGQDHIRNDFLTGSNGAESLEETDLTYLDEFYPLVSPSRDDEEKDEGAETTETKKSFDCKMAEAAVHLDKFLKGDETEICGTTYKYLKELVNRIHKSGYLDNIPDPPSEETDPPTAPSEVQEVQVEAETTEEDEDYSASSVNPSHPIDSPEVTGFNQSGQGEVSQQQVTDIPNPPEPIEMPPPKSNHPHDVNDVLAPVEGGVTFLQESMLELDPSHIDPAVVAVSLMPSQSYMSTAAFQSTSDSSSMDRQGTPSSQIDQSVDSLRQVSQSDSVYPPPPDSVYTQNIYESQQNLMGNTGQASMTATQHDFSSQQNLQTQQSMGGPQGIVTQQGYIDQASYASQAAGLNSGPGLGSVPNQGDYGNTQQQQDYGASQQQQDYSNSQQQDYSNSHQGLSGGRQNSASGGQTDGAQNVGYNSPGNQGLTELRTYRNSPIDPQLTKPEERQSSSPDVYQQGSLQTSQFGSTEMSSKDGFGQPMQGTGQMNTDVSGGSATPPQSIPFPNEAQSPQSLSKDGLEEPTLPKSTMNAAAPPFQSSARTSPQMSALQGSTPEDSNFSSSSSMQAASDTGHPSSAGKKSESETRSVEYRSSPPNIDNNYQYQSYPNSYTRNNRGSRGGRGGAMGSPGYRNPRGGSSGLPFIRNTPRFNNSNIQRGGYPSGYIPQPRENFQPRTQEMGFTQAPYNTFNRPQETGYYRGRGGVNRGAPRGGRAWRE